MVAAGPGTPVGKPSLASAAVTRLASPTSPTPSRTVTWTWEGRRVTPTAWASGRTDRCCSPPVLVVVLASLDLGFHLVERGLQDDLDAADVHRLTVRRQRRHIGVRRVDDAEIGVRTRPRPAVGHRLEEHLAGSRPRSRRPRLSRSESDVFSSSVSDFSSAPSSWVTASGLNSRLTSVAVRNTEPRNCCWRLMRSMSESGRPCRWRTKATAWSPASFWVP